LRIAGCKTAVRRAADSGFLPHSPHDGAANPPPHRIPTALFRHPRPKPDRLLALAAVQHDPRWNARARELTAAMLARFTAPDGTLSSSPASDALPFPIPLQGDVHRPSGQSAAIAVLLALAQTGQPQWAEAARRALRPIALQVSARPLDWPDLLQTLDGAAGRAVFVAAANSGDSRPADCAGLPQGACSADQVRTQWLRAGSGWVLQLDIAPGFHVNANPASLPNLIPTTVLLDGKPLVAGVRYPPPQTFRPAFAPQAIAVWEGRVRLEIPALTPQQGALAVKVQACNATTCLAPSVIQVGRPTLSRPQTLRRVEAE